MAGERVAAIEPGARPPAGAEVGVRASADASELRNVTVLIADIVHSTRTVMNFEPEDARAYLDRAIQPMLAGVRKFGGSIVSTQGDNVIAVFGAGISTEDHALRACLAAIEIRDAILTLPPFGEDVPTRARIGVHSGGVWTRPRRLGETEELDANGAVVHIASKIERLCPPESAAVSAATLRLLRGYVRSAPLAALSVDDDQPPLEIRQLLEVSPDYQLEHYFAGRRLSPLVGRAGELHIITEALARSSPSVLGMIGEAGLGKSRLCFEAGLMAEKAGRRVVQLRGVSVNSATPFAPLRACLTQLLLLDEGQPADEARAALAEVGLAEMEAEGVAQVLGIGDPDGVWKRMSGDARKRAITHGVARTIRAAAQRLPLLLIIEDLHDLDQETLSCLMRALKDPAPCPAIATSRPEKRDALGQLCGQVLVLEHLAAVDARRLVMNAASAFDELASETPEDLVGSVLERGAGNPFVLEELVRGVLRPSSRGIGGVPMSVEILIRSRVDRLSPAAKRLMHCASVIGMRFPALILRRVAEVDAASFETALRELVSERLLIADPGLSVEFAHQITQLATYEGIPRAGRARLHARVLEAALADPHRLALSREALAGHAYRAGDKALALDFLWEACRESIANSAVQSVIELHRQALAICREVGKSADMREVDFNLLAFDALAQQGAFHDLVAPLERALSLAEAAGAQRQVCQVSSHLATTYWVIAQYERAYAKAMRALAEARAAGNLPIASYAQYVLGCIQFHRGRIIEAAQLERELIQHLSGALETARFGAVTVLSVTCRAFLSWFVSDLGDFAEAEENTVEAMRVADAMQQPYSQLLAHAALGYRLFRMERIEEACAALEIAHGMCRAGRFLALDAIISGWFASALVRCGRDEESRRVVQRVIEDDLGRYCCVAGTYYTYDAKARLLARAGRAEEAIQALEHGVELMRATRDRPHYAYALYSRGELKRELGIEAGTAARDFRWAQRRAQVLGMKHLETECGRALDAAG